VIGDDSSPIGHTSGVLLFVLNSLSKTLLFFRLNFFSHFCPQFVAISNQKRTQDDLSMETTVETTAVLHTNGDTIDVNDNNNTIVENNNEIAKKVKYEAKTTPAVTDNRLSRVVHVRNIPADTAEPDLIALSAGFGRVTNCLILRGKSQAFIEFSDAHSAQQMVNYWLQTTAAGIPAPMQPTIRGRHVFCQLSNHKELKTNNSHHNQLNDHLSSHTTDLTTNGGQTSREPTCVLRVVVDNLLYAVSLDVLHSVFSRAGKVAKIVTFTKNGAFQALIQFESAREAQQAKMTLDGQCLFHHANTLRVEFSKLTQLNVKYNNDKSRDYTNAQLPALQPDVMDLNSLLTNQSQQQLFANPFAVNQSVNALRALNPLHALSQLQSQSLGQLGAHLGLGQANGLSGGHGMSQSAVLLVSNLNESTTTTDALFTLFGVYGDVIRVKILFNKKDNALIQLAEPQQAQLAQTYLDKVKLSGRVIRVTPSKHQLVQMPKEGQHDAGLTKDFSQSALHRFKKPGSKNYGNIYPPSATLHLSNIPSTVAEEDIRAAFTRETGCHVVAFKFFPKDRKMALIQLQSVDDSIQALIKMHNYQLSESSHLRVSFSKSSI
jgi:polypyrimidine tract-binding protein 1